MIDVPQTLVIILVVVSSLAWLVQWRNNRRRVSELQGELASQEKKANELAAEGISLKTKLTEAQIALARLEASAGRVLHLESQIAGFRETETSLTWHQSTLETTESRLAEVEASLEAERARIEELVTCNVRLESERSAEEEAYREKVEALTSIRTDIEEKIKSIAGEALRGSQESFVTLANQVLENHHSKAAQELDQRKVSIEALLAPLSQSLEQYRTGLLDMERVRQSLHGGLVNELRSLAEGQLAVRSETGKLVNALRAAPTTRGRWGEYQLQNVLELAGMAAHVDYSCQQSFVRDNETLRPDAVIRLPGGRHIIVDAKTSLSAYLDAVEAVDDETREAHLALHARQIRQHVRQLGSKAYWDSLTETPDFVVMFVPGDNFYSAAIEKDPQLFEDAINQRVIISTPTTLVALAKAIAFGWRQEKVAQNAQEVGELGRELYKRLQRMGVLVADLGKNLDRTVRTYNGFVGSLEGSLMPHARKFQTLEVQGAHGDFQDLSIIEANVRTPQTGRDLELPENSASTVSLDVLQAAE